MKNILFTTYHLCIVIVNIYVLERQNMRVFSLNLDVKLGKKILKSLLLLSVEICLVEGMVSL